MKVMRGFAIFLLLALTVLLTLPVSAETIVVACSPAALRTAINQANNSPGDTTLTLTAGCSYSFSDISSTGTGAALPNVGSNIIIVGNGATIQRSGGSNFRLFYVTGGHLHLQSLTVRGGIAPALGGGGIYVAGGSLTLDHSALIQNSAPGLNGGGVLAAGTVNLFNTTVSGNSAAAGGGVYIDGAAADIRHATIAANTATGSGGGVTRVGSGNLNLYHSIIGNNSGSAPADLASDSVGLGGFNIIETANTNIGNTSEMLDPLIGALANNGGLTLTHLPLANSPALETGDPAFNSAGQTDQRGQPRGAGQKTDVGAVEIPAAATVNVSVNSSAANGVYSTDASIPITLTFSTTIQFAGTPLLTLETRPPGEEDSRAAWPSSGVSTSPTSTIQLVYTVANGDNSADLDYVTGQPLVLPVREGGPFPVPHTRILSAAGLPVNLNIPAPGAPGSLGANKSLVINSAPRVVSVALIAPAGGGETTPTRATFYTFRVTFSEPVIGVDGLTAAPNPDFTTISAGGNCAPLVRSITGINPLTPRPGTLFATQYHVTVQVTLGTGTLNNDCLMGLRIEDYVDDTGQRLILDQNGNPYLGPGQQDNQPNGSDPDVEDALVDYAPPNTQFSTGTPSSGADVGQMVPIFFRVNRGSSNNTEDPNASTDCAVVAGSHTVPPGGTVFTDCTSPWNANMPVVGMNTIFLRSTDSVENVEPDFDSQNRRQFNRIGDATVPDTSITGGPAQGSVVNTTTVEFTFAASGADGTPTFRCKLDDGNFTTCTSPRTLNNLEEGPHTFSVFAVDGPPGVEQDMTPATRTFNVDLTLPVVTITSPPNDNITLATAPPFSFTASEPSTFQCSFRPQGSADVFSACTSPFTPTGPFTDGFWVFKVRATDGATNQGPAAPRTVILDTTGPETTLNMFPTNPTADTTPTFTYSSSEGGTRFQCRLYRTSVPTPPAFINCDGGVYTHAPPLPASNNFTFEVRALDVLGNPDATPASFAFDLDIRPPETTITSEPSSPTSDTTPTWNFTANEPATFQCSLVVQGQPDVFGGCVGLAGTHTPPSPLADRTYTFKVRAIDVVENVDPTPATDTVTIDTTPNTFISLHPPTPTNDPTPTWAYTSNQAGASFVCSLVPQGQEDEFAVCNGTGTGTFTPAEDLRDGTYIFKVSAVADPILTGGVYVADQTPAMSTVVIVGAPPDTLIVVEPTASTSDTMPTWEFISNETGSTFQCSLVVQGNPDVFGACNDVDGNATVFSHTPASALAQATYTFKVRATDLDSNTDATPATDTVVIDTTAPDTIITFEPPPTTDDATPTWAFTSSEAGSTFECSLVVQAQPDVFLECTGRSLTQHTPELPLADGTYTFKVRATDAARNLDATPATDTVVVDAIVIGPVYLEPEINVTDGVNAIADDTGSYSYPATTVGSPVSATFTVENSGSADLVGSNLSVPAGFSVSAVSGMTIEPGTTETFTITCDATAAGSFSGLVSFENNDIHENPYDFTLSCEVSDVVVEPEPTEPSEEPTAPAEPTVETEEPVETETPVATEDPVVTEEPVVTEAPTPEPTLEPSELTVLDEETPVADDAQVALEAGETLTLTIRNDGAGDLILERNQLLEGAPAVTVDGGFTLSDDVDTEDTTLASGAEAEFEVSCPAAGGISGTLEIVSNDADENPFELTLVCAPAPTPEPTPTEAPTPEATQVLETQPEPEEPAIVEAPVIEESPEGGEQSETTAEGTSEAADA